MLCRIQIPLSSTVFVRVALAALVTVLVLAIVAIPLRTFAAAYNIAGATFNQVALDVSGQESTPTSMLFNDDGTVLYVLGESGDDINEYTLSSAYDISSASFNQIALDVSAQDANPYSMLFNDDGTVLYVLGRADDDINEYTLSSAYDISSASFNQIALDVSGQEDSPSSMLFNDDGTTLYVMGTGFADNINEYTLSTAYDISSASFNQVALDVSAQEPTALSMLFNDDGTTLYVMGNSGDDINEYTLSTGYDISSASFNQIALDVSGQDATPYSMLFNDDGTVLYVLGREARNIYEYTIDVTDPTVSLTAPDDGATVSGSSVTISANASDDISVAGVKFYVDGALQDSEDTTSPYSINWDSTATTSGAKTIEAVARDSAGNVATSSSITATVDNTPTPSSVSAATDSASSTITWTTAKAGSSRVYFGIASSLASSTSETNTGGNEVTSHSVTLTGLVSCTAYAYQVVSRSPNANDTATSSESTFETTGCTGDASISANSQDTITTAAGGTLTHSTLTLTVPTSFTATSSSAIFQAETIDTTAFSDSAGTPSGKTRAGPIYNLKAFTDATTTLATFDESITVEFTYTNADIDGLDESSLQIYRYDGSAWSALDSCSVDTAANSVSCTTTAFSEFGIFGDEASSESSSSSSGSMPWCSGPTAPGWNTSLPGGGCGSVAIATATTTDTPSAESVASDHTDTSASALIVPATRDLYRGTVGDDVRQLQILLNTLGFTVADTGPGSPGSETNYFGPATQAALATFQSTHNITPSAGYFGPITRDFIAQLDDTVLDRSLNKSTEPNTDTPATPATFTRDLTIGATGDDVVVLQNFLMNRGYAIPAGATGYFGPQTRSALAAFQKDNAINPPQGYFGPITRTFLKGDE